jgi:hypothetical protein
MGGDYITSNKISEGKMYSATVDSIFHECAFCKIQGVLEKSIFNKEGWYFCRPCLSEVEYELKKRKAEKILL